MKEKIKKRLLDLRNGMAIWEVHIDLFRERNKNARIMAQKKFSRLSKNIEIDKRLESLPLSFIQANGEFGIISGHHRIRAARTAKIKKIYTLVIEEEISEDEIKSKQLAHNALSGEDDEQILKEIFESIDSVGEKLKSGIFEDELEKELASIDVDEIQMELDFEIVNLIFLDSQKKRFEDVIECMTADKTIHVASLKNFTLFKKNVQKVASTEDIRNISSIFHRMMEIVKDYYGKKEAKRA